MEHAEFDRLLSAAFHGGEQVCRELRLSDEDARYLADHYPAAAVTPMGEQWYQVTFEGAIQVGA
ncbi:MAG: hypothetical protein ACI4O3_01245 [Oscillospiraceae bacterium]